jgi:hypothetical protein
VYSQKATSLKSATLGKITRVKSTDSEKVARSKLASPKKVASLKRAYMERVTSLKSAPLEKVAWSKLVSPEKVASPKRAFSKKVARPKLACAETEGSSPTLRTGSPDESALCCRAPPAFGA